MKSIFQQFLFFISLFILVQCKKDDTTKPGGSGRAVMEAVDRKLKLSGIFQHDYRFIQRLAWVESNFGNSGVPPGGLWRLSSTFFDRTKNINNFPHLILHHTAISIWFGINWNSVNYNDLQKPLYSVIGAHLYFTTINRPNTPPQIPQLISGQADFWFNYYNGEFPRQHFLDKVDEFEDDTVCKGKMDFIILLDSSGSINTTDYAIAKEFVWKLIDSLSWENVRVGFTIYSDYVEQIFELNNTLSSTAMEQRVLNATHISSSTNTAEGILNSINQFKKYPSTNGVPQVLSVFTDGKSSPGYPILPAIQALNQTKIISLGVGITSAINDEELLQIARGIRQRVFLLESFNALEEFVYELNSETCSQPQTPASNSTVSDLLERNEMRFYNLEIPPQGITAKIEVVEGQTVGYFSYDWETPSSAINDGEFTNEIYIPQLPTTNENRVGNLAGNQVFIGIEGKGNKNNYTFENIEGNHSSGGKLSFNSLMFLMLALGTVSL